MLFDLYFLFTYGSQLEQGTFAGRSADFAWFVIFTCLSSSVGQRKIKRDSTWRSKLDQEVSNINSFCSSLQVVANYMGSQYLFQSLLIAVIYLWSRSNSDRIVSFMFGIQFKVPMILEQE